MTGAQTWGADPYDWHAAMRRLLPTPEQDRDFERIHRVLSACVYKVCPRDLLPVADDIAQTASTKLLARVRAEGLEVDYGPGYLWKVANHAVIDEIRRRQRRIEEPSEDADQAPAPGGDAAQGEHRARILRGVRACLSEAKPDRRAALGLYLQGMKLQEVAKSLRCEAKRADNLVHRGLAALRACLDKKGLRP